MSIAHIDAIFKAPPEAGGALLVLLALADEIRSGDCCWPGVARLMQKTRQSERGVQTALQALKAQGLVTITSGYGRNRTNLYTLHLQAPQHLHPEESAPRSICTPQMDTETPQITAENPAASAPKPPMNHKRTTKGVRARDTGAFAVGRPAVEIPDWLVPEAWEMWVRHRRAIRKPLTADAARLTISKLDKFREQGHDPQELIDLAVSNGWAGIWPPKTEGSSHGSKHSDSQSAAATRQQRIDDSTRRVYASAVAASMGTEAGPQNGIDEAWR